jgi:hypothetical protein
MPVLTQHKPVLDEKSFQQLLAAAYTLQEYITHAALESEARKVQFPVLATQMPTGQGSCTVAACQVVGVQEWQRDEAEPQQSDGNFAHPSHPSRRACKVFLNRHVFRKVAAAAILSTVSGFLMGSDYHPFSALPFALRPATEFGQRSLRLEPNQYSATIPVATSPVELSVDGAEILSTEHLRPSHSRQHRLHHRSREGDVVAPDTVIRYGTGFAAQGSQIQQERQSR